MITSLLAAAVLTLQTPPAPQAAPEMSLRDITIRPIDYVIFHQVIDDDSVDRVAPLLKPGVILDMQSMGGDFRASLRFARLVRAERARVRVSGECSSGCAVVWATAGDRIADGFSAVTFHGNPISSWDWIQQHRSHFSADELAYAEGEATAFRELLAEAGIEPWLFQCANRLQNQRHTFIENPTTADRIDTVEDYQVVWFPRSILEAAGVRVLDRYDRPNERQREAIETEYGSHTYRRKIYWAQDGDCDPDRVAAGQAVR